MSSQEHPVTPSQQEDDGPDKNKGSQATTNDGTNTCTPKTDKDKNLKGLGEKTEECKTGIHNDENIDGGEDNKEDDGIDVLEEVDSETSLVQDPAEPDKDKVRLLEY